MKYLEERAFKYDLEDIINITNLNYSSAAYMKDKWNFSDRMSLFGHWSKVDMEIVKDYQRYVNQFSTNYGVISSWLCDILHNSVNEDFSPRLMIHNL